MTTSSLIALAGLVGAVIGCDVGDDPVAGPSTEGETFYADPATNFLDEVYAGYQGWFTTEADGVFNGWFHWAGNRNGGLAPGFDLLPDTTIYPAAVLTPAAFAGGHPLFSSVHPQVIETHFRLIANTHIDGFAVQRFIGDLHQSEAENSLLRHKNTVLRQVRRMADRHHKKFYVMYDISGGRGDWAQTIKNDFSNIIDSDMRLFESEYYARQRGRIVVALWGVGFTDRPGTAQETQDLIDWFRREHDAFLIGGVPSRWRDGVGDSKPGFKNVFLSFDVIQPWMVGRFRSEGEASSYYAGTVDADLAEARRAGVGYQTVIFPGFSWTNLLANNNQTARLNEIPRLAGRFLWTQARLAAQRQMTTFVAMFDEYDEGTAIAPAVTSRSAIPSGYSFLTLDADGVTMTSDFYVRLTSEIAEMQKSRVARASFSTPYLADPLVPPAGAGQPRPAPLHEIVATHSGKCMEVSGSGQSPGDVIRQWSCDGGADQRWTLHDEGDGTFTIRSERSGHCLDVIDGSVANDGQFQQWPCIAGASNQRWRLAPNGGPYQVVSSSSGKCMSVADGNQADGARVRQWDCLVKANFLFELRRVN